MEPREYNYLARIEASSVKQFCPVCTSEIDHSPDPDNRLTIQESKTDTLIQTVSTLQTQNQMILSNNKKRFDGRLEKKVAEQVRERFEGEREREETRNNHIMYNCNSDTLQGSSSVLLYVHRDRADY